MTVRRVRPGSIEYPPYFPYGGGLLARSLNSGASEYIEVDVSPVTAYPITFGCWWYPTDDTVQSEFFCICDSSVGFRWIALGSRSDGADFRARFRSNDADNEYVWGEIIVQDSWSHVIARCYDEDDVDIWTNGIEDSGALDQIDVANLFDRVSIGRLGDSTPSNYADGAVLLPAIWNIALANAQILDLYHGAYPWEVAPGHLVGLWLTGPRNDRDYGRYGNHMAAFNTPTWRPGNPKQVNPLIFDAPKGFVAGVPPVGAPMTPWGRTWGPPT